MTDASSGGGEIKRRKPDVEAEQLKLDLTVAPNRQVDLSQLPKEQREELQRRHAELAIQAHDRAINMAVDVKAMDQKLETVIEKATEAAEAGAALTYTNVLEDHLGHSEVIIGTSDAAKAGKLSRSQTGLQDNQKLLLIIAGAVAALLLLILALK